ncbi:hypothetical protein OC845_005062, partial [Tilletia horrida]
SQQQTLKVEQHTPLPRLFGSLGGQQAGLATITDDVDMDEDPHFASSQTLHNSHTPFTMTKSFSTSSLESSESSLADLSLASTLSTSSGTSFASVDGDSAMMPSRPSSSMSDSARLFRNTLDKYSLAVTARMDGPFGAASGPIPISFQEHDPLYASASADRSIPIYGASVPSPLSVLTTGTSESALHFSSLGLDLGINNDAEASHPHRHSIAAGACSRTSSPSSVTDQRSNSLSTVGSLPVSTSAFHPVTPIPIRSAADYRLRLGFTSSNNRLKVSLPPISLPEHNFAMSAAVPLTPGGSLFFGARDGAANAIPMSPFNPPTPLVQGSNLQVTYEQQLGADGGILGSAYAAQMQNSQTPSLNSPRLSLPHQVDPHSQHAAQAQKTQVGPHRNRLQQKRASLPHVLVPMNRSFSSPNRSPLSRPSSRGGMISPGPRSASPLYSSSSTSVSGPMGPGSSHTYDSSALLHPSSSHSQSPASSSSPSTSAATLAPPSGLTPPHSLSPLGGSGASDNGSTILGPKSDCSGMLTPLEIGPSSLPGLAPAPAFPSPVATPHGGEIRQVFIPAESPLMESIPSPASSLHLQIDLPSAEEIQAIKAQSARSSLVSTAMVKSMSAPAAAAKTVSARYLSRHTLHPRFAREYTLGDELGSGGFGFVVSAMRNADSFPVAVKFIWKEKVPSQGWVRDRDLGVVPMEVFVLKTVRHPSVIRFIDLFDDDQFFYLVMELHGTPWKAPAPKTSDKKSGASEALMPSQQGNAMAPVANAQDPSKALLPPRPAPMERRSSCDLFECIEQHSRLNEEQARWVFAQVVEAVYHLDSLGITHRDIKDENCVVDADFNVKLIDFGSAVVSDPRAPAPFFNRFYGTMTFASAEILQGKLYRAPQAEVWSLGVLLSILLSGECPFADPSAAIKGRISKPKGQWTAASLELMMRCLDVDPNRRATIAEVRECAWVRKAWDLRGVRRPT